MKIKEFLRGYVSKNGNATFVHTVEATAKELKAIDDAKALDPTAAFLGIDAETKERLVWLNDEFAEGTPLATTRNGKRIYAVVPLLSTKIQVQRDKILALSSVLDSGRKINSRLLAAYNIE